MKKIEEVGTYEEAIDYIMSTPKFTAKNSMENTRCFLEHLGNPCCDRKIIHVAGTNGKGSVCAYLHSILQEAEISSGMFISPHLVTMRERFVIEGQMISEQEFLEAFQGVAKGLLTLPEQLRQTEYHPTFFEFLFFMAMLVFEKRQVEYLILETGLGGRLDATNSVYSKQVCVITSIGYDHMEYLGNTLPEIAGEKTGILRKETPVVYRKGEKIPTEVTTVIEQAAAKVGAKCVPVSDLAIKEIRKENKTIDFSLYINYYDYVGFTVSTTAFYQVENAALALYAVTCLEEKRIILPMMQAGIRKAFWEGRMEEILPSVYLDGAHNTDGMRAFLETVAKHEENGRRRLLYSVVKDKQYKAVIEQIAQSRLFDRIELVALEDERALPLETLEETFGQYAGCTCTGHATLSDALEALLADWAAGENAYITGSLYLVGEIKALLRSCKND